MTTPDLPPISTDEAHTFVIEHSIYSLEDSRSSTQICEELRTLGGLMLSDGELDELAVLNRALQDQRTAFRFPRPGWGLNTQDPLAY